MKICDKGF